MINLEFAEMLGSSSIISAKSSSKTEGVLICVTAETRQKQIFVLYVIKSET